MSYQDKINETEAWLIENNIDDIEVMLPDCAGIARGKSMPRAKFIGGMRSRSLRLPESIFGITVNGEFCFNKHLAETERDIIIVPDLNTIVSTPWQKEPTAAVIGDAETEEGEANGLSPRQVLRHVIDLYSQKSWKPIVAPEFEFYLIARQKDLAMPPKPPIGKSGVREVGTEPYSIDGVDEFGDLFDDLYDYCEAQNIEIETLIHEAGPAQFELNVNHGDAMAAADQSFYIKRVIRQVALQHGMFATFMARPYPDGYGSSMHLHQSVIDTTTGKNIFANADGSDSDLFLSHIAGLQKYMPTVMPMLAPFVNSYMRLAAAESAPTNLHWARENRSVGLRVPTGDNSARRIENRVAGSDANPYLAIAASLACGYLGMEEALEPSDPLEGSAYDITTRSLPSHMLDGIGKMDRCKPIRNILGDGFVDTYLQIKRTEFENYSSFLSPWETTYLMLNV